MIEIGIIICAIFLLLVSIFLGNSRNNKILIRYGFNLVNIMLVHPFIHCHVQLVQEFYNLHCTKIKYSVNVWSSCNYFFCNPWYFIRSLQRMDKRFILIVYLHFWDTLLKPSTQEKYKVAWSKVSATCSPPWTTRSTIIFGSILWINFSCFLFCLFMSSDFFSTLRANIFKV